MRGDGERMLWLLPTAGSSYASSAFSGSPSQGGGAQSALDYAGYAGYGPQSYPYYAQGYGYVQAAAAAAAGAVASPLAPSTYQLAQLPPVAAQQHGTLSQTFLTRTVHECFAVT